MVDDADISVFLVNENRAKNIAAKVIIYEILVRGALFGLLWGAYYVPTFVREVQYPDWHKYNFPRTEPARITSQNLALLCVGGYLFLACCLALFVLASCWFPYYCQFNTDTFNESRRFSRSSFAKTVLHQQLRLGLAISLSFLLTAVSTNFVKNWYGGPRPDFLSRCKPEGFKPSEPRFDLLPPVPICTGDPLEVIEGRRSFPSGHASYAFSVYLFMGLFFYHHLLKPFSASIGGVRLVAFCISLLPGVYCGLSRTMDYRHHPIDVFVGSLLGSCFAFWSYWTYYPRRPTISEDRRMLAADPTEVVNHIATSDYESVNNALTPTSRSALDNIIVGRSKVGDIMSMTSSRTPSLERPSIRNTAAASQAATVVPSPGLQSSGSRRSLDN